MNPDEWNSLGSKPPSDPPPDLKRGNRVRKASAPQSTDRLPPHSPEAETGTLGCILLSPKETLPECIETFGDNAVFYDLRNMTIYEAMVAMYDRNDAIDVITLQQYLKDNDMLEQVGGLQYLASLPDTVPSASNLSYYTDIVREKFYLRKMVNTCTEVVAKVYEYEGKVDELMDEVSRDILRVTEDRERVGLKLINKLVQDSIQKIEDYSQRNGDLTGIATGFSDLDRITSGLQPSEMIVIAARPSCGKTSLAMNIADNVAVTNRIPTGVFSLEMTAESLTMRMICSRARVNLRNVTEGFLAERDFPKITGAAGRIANSPLYIDDTASLTLIQLRAKMRRMVMQFGIKLGIIDYLQLLRAGSRRDGRQQEVSDISAGIKALAKELGIPIIVLSQLNRELEKDGKRKPRLSDIRESGSIEQDADTVGFLYKPKLYDDDDDDSYSDAIGVNLLIAKQRNGPTGEVFLTFLKSYTRFETAAKVGDEDLPQDQAQMFND